MRLSGAAQSSAGTRAGLTFSGGPPDFGALTNIPPLVPCPAELENVQSLRDSNYSLTSSVSSVPQPALRVCDFFEI